MTNQLTAEQTAILGACGKSFAIRALAGTGKTFCLERLVERFKEQKPTANVLCTVFNKRNAEELRERIPGADCATFNSLGLNLCKSHLPKAKTDVQKSRKLLDAYIEEESLGDLLKRDDLYTLRGVLEKSLSMLSAWAVRPEGHEQLPGGVPWPGAELREYLIDAGVDAPVWTLPYITAFYERNFLEACQGRLSFNDQLLLPVLHSWRSPKYQLICIDEVQDMSRVQMDLALSFQAPRGRVVIVGDPHQAIYGFRGGSWSHAEELISSRGLEVHSITRSFRCSEPVAAVARRRVPDFQAFFQKRPGKTGNRDYANWTAAEVQPGDACISYYNATLISTAFKLLRQGKKPKLWGARSIKGAIERRVFKPVYGGISDPMALLAAIEKDTSELVQLLRSKQLEHAAAAEADAAECIRALILGAIEDKPNIRVSGLKAYISRTLDEENGEINLMTIHKSKGHEFNRVFFLTPENTLTSDRDPAKSQKDNLYYVGATRAKHELYAVWGNYAKLTRAHFPETSTDSPEFLALETS